jgi:hypothetical protein
MCEPNKNKLTRPLETKPDAVLKNICENCQSEIKREIAYEEEDEREYVARLEASKSKLCKACVVEQSKFCDNCGSKNELQVEFEENPQIDFEEECEGPISESFLEQSPNRRLCSRLLCINCRNAKKKQFCENCQSEIKREIAYVEEDEREYVARLEASKS